MSEEDRRRGLLYESGKGGRRLSGSPMTQVIRTAIRISVVVLSYPVWTVICHTHTRVAADHLRPVALVAQICGLVFSSALIERRRTWGNIPFVMIFAAVIFFMHGGLPYLKNAVADLSAHFDSGALLAIVGAFVWGMVLSYGLFGWSRNR